MIENVENSNETQKPELGISDVMPSLPCDESTKPKVENVGEEFMKWAEQYWALEKIISKGFGDGAESCPYSYMRGIFVNKINELSGNEA